MLGHLWTLRKVPTASCSFNIFSRGDSSLLYVSQWLSFQQFSFADLQANCFGHVAFDEGLLGIFIDINFTATYAPTPALTCSWSVSVLWKTSNSRDASGDNDTALRGSKHGKTWSTHLERNWKNTVWHLFLQERKKTMIVCCILSFTLNPKSI